MTDRLKGFIVTLEEDIREDDAADIITAIGMIRGVLSCKPLVRDYGDLMAHERVRRELGQKLLDVLKEKP
jgi:hypothetical protein